MTTTIDTLDLTKPADALAVMLHRARCLERMAEDDPQSETWARRYAFAVMHLDNRLAESDVWTVLQASELAERLS